ncbi:hypothetical protein VAE308_900007 [Vibrio aestuarianus]|uniref:Uncharacterized protein n=1 Tax=Vibrio aestuarianus TaxID=28171 RepID=A0ABM9FKS2_9VIBR|nr:hypothetical protein VAE142_240004 [Vibrio aestuarianus]CAH8205874.1 hypothetical protein VAE063_170004 [Vibrio aestuarianus]CAH8235065.1 hypothetical protein VAE308_900007 [Vibrio aestuarianus]CAH8235912.1 hypothetical protein VAE128_640003 [Vibrio aestuarianus]CAH8242346.1 hypothetical protein VAE122_3990002 [Vibrio aestuarianus]
MINLFYNLLLGKVGQELAREISHRSGASAFWGINKLAKYD